MNMLNNLPVNQYLARNYVEGWGKNIKQNTHIDEI